MPTFHNPQVFPFSYRLTEPDSPMRVEAFRDGEGFRYEFSQTRWQFLARALEDQPPLLPSPSGDRDFWLRVLDYDENEELDFVTLDESGPAFPEEVLECWPDNVAYEYQIWARERTRYEKWIDRVRGFESTLTEPIDWEQGPPEEKHLRSLEYELHLPLPHRPSVLLRLHALGILGPEDQGRISTHLVSLSCRRLVAWREASLLHRWVSQFVEGMWPEEAGHQLSSPVGVDWFLGGPYEQKHLDPLPHLKFALHHHLKREPPEIGSSFVVSMGGRISGAFFYSPGPGGISQLTHGGAPSRRSTAYDLYQYETTDGSDRVAEVAARAIRQGWFVWGGKLAARWLEERPAHAQSWVELGVALDALGHPAWARACLGEAGRLGLSFSVRGELGAIWEREEASLPPFADLTKALNAWQDELPKLTSEELTAVVLTSDISGLADIRKALLQAGLPPVLRRFLT